MAASEQVMQGTPCWVSLSARDLDAAQEFYRSVMGWEFRPGTLGEEFVVAYAADMPVAGLSSIGGRIGIAVSWTSYFSVESADIAASRIGERGGTVAIGPLSFDTGRAVIASDPAGAVFGVWEGEQRYGWEVGHGSAPGWLELRTRDAFASAIFYAEVFEWGSGRGDRGDVSYELDEVFVRAGGHTVAGLRGGGVEDAPDPQTRPRWRVYFCVEDADAAAAAAERAGGSTVESPSDSSMGRVAMLRDPEGALFMVTSHTP